MSRPVVISNRVIQMTRLGDYGRFGNQLFQYAFLRAYAERNQCEFQTPHWIGEDIFSLPCKRPNVELPTLAKERLAGEINIDAIGYFQNSYCLTWYRRPWVKEIFKINDHMMKKTRYNTGKVVVHKRRGDYVNNPAFCTVSDKAYGRFIDKMGFTDVIVFDDSRPADLWLSDFITMINAKVLIRSNSSFAWWAGTLGNATVYAPVVDDKTGTRDDIEFVRGNFPRTCDTRNIPGSTIHDDLFLGE